MLKTAHLRRAPRRAPSKRPIRHASNELRSLHQDTEQALEELDQKFAVLKRTREAQTAPDCFGVWFGVVCWKKRDLGGDKPTLEEDVFFYRFKEGFFGGWSCRIGHLKAVFLCFCLLLLSEGLLRRASVSYFSWASFTKPSLEGGSNRVYECL